MGCNCKFQICIGEGHLYNITTVKSSVSRFSPFQEFPLRDPIQNTADLPCVSENLIQERKLCRIQKQNVRLGRTIESCAPLLCSSLTGQIPAIEKVDRDPVGKIDPWHSRSPCSCPEAHPACPRATSTGETDPGERANVVRPRPLFTPSRLVDQGEPSGPLLCSLWASRPLFTPSRLIDRPADAWGQPSGPLLTGPRASRC